MKILVVVPARGQSKGIPRKNIRMLKGKPLIAYGICNALGLRENYDVDVVVDTDDEEIAEISCQYGAGVVMRTKELSGDNVTLDPVVNHALMKCENDKGIRYDVVITMQPTSPTLQRDTVLRALNRFFEQNVDTMLSVVNTPHLSWTTEDGKIVPNYEERLNRQQLPNHYKETGAFLITKRECVTDTGRIGRSVSVFEVNEDEAVDIDNELDWKLCENVLSTKKILLRADGEENLGMGHIYRCLSIAYHLTGHKILFVTNAKYGLGIQKLKESYFPLQIIQKNEDIIDVIKKYQPDIVINDILDTSKEYVQKLKEYVKRVVNFEDKGEGADWADCTINALYQSTKKPNTYNGFRYYFIRDEFLTTVPKLFQEEVKNITVLFGGSDPSNLTSKAYAIFQAIAPEHPQIEFHIITGFGYRYKNVIKDDMENRIYIHNDVRRVSKYLQKADLALTSQGRTIYELACMGVPAIVLAQNERETQHIFANITNGFINLGIGNEQDNETIKSTIDWLICTPNVRRQMHEALLRRDFTSGQNRVIKLILGEEEDDTV